MSAIICDAVKVKRNSVLITGGNGFIGSNLVRTLIKKNYIVHLLVRKNSNLDNIKDLSPLLSTHIINPLELKNLEKIISDISPEFIFHLASYGNSSYHTDVDKMIQTNVVYLKNILEASTKIPYKLFINTGSSSEYGFKTRPMQEDMLLEPISHYATTKAAGTHLSQVYAKMHSKPIITFRLFSVYGPNEDQKRLIPTAIHNAIVGKPILLTPGSVKRDFIYVEDVVAAYLQAMNIPLGNGTVYNIGTGNQFTNDEVVKMIGKILQKKLNIIKGSYKARSWDTDNWVADIRKAKRELLWSPSSSLENGLSKMIDWYKSR